MRGTVLLACVAAIAKELTPNLIDDRHGLVVKCVNTIIDSLFDHEPKVWTLHRETLHKTTLEKPGHPVQQSFSPSSSYVALHSPSLLHPYPAPQKVTSKPARAAAETRATRAESLQRTTVQASAADAAAGRFHLPFDVSYPGLRVVHADPPVVLIDDFLPQKTCENLMTAGEASGSLARAKMRFRDEAGREYNVASENRTSRSMYLFDDELDRGGQALRDAQEQLQDKAKALLPRCQWGEYPAYPVPEKLFFEYLQLSKYEHGQHFLEHEDAFEPNSAAALGFQRLATLIVYLNDVQAGGETRFDHLGLSITPIAGTALLFFPAFADGSPDARTLHTGTSAVSTKWIAQQWIASKWSEERVSVRLDTV